MFMPGIVIIVCIVAFIRILCAGSKGYESTYSERDSATWIGVGITQGDHYDL